MLDYLIKFNQLPQDLRDRFTAPKIVTAISELEQKYQLSLAVLVMKIMVQEVKFSELANYFASTSNLTIHQAEQVCEELKEKIFFGLESYLGIQTLVKFSEHQALVKAIEPGLPNIIKKSEAQTEIEELASELKESPLIEVEPVEHPDVKQERVESEEIKSINDKLQEAAQPVTEPSREAELDQIIKLAQINFSSQLLVDRFRQILSTYLRGIRSKIDTKAALTKTFAAGGLSFDDGSADQVLSLIESLKNPSSAVKTSAPKKIVLPEDSLAALQAVGMRDMEYDLASAIKAKKESAENSTSAAVVAEPEAPFSLKNLAEVKQQKNDANPESIAPEVRKNFFRRSRDAGNKIKIEDVKVIPKTMGPVDEIKYLDLTSFRRLDKDPVGAVLKIKEKINFLESEQYSLRLQAIKAWRQCQINRLYLAIGEAAIAENRPVDQIIAANQAKGQDYLNNSEFEAIMSLNKELRF